MFHTQTISTNPLVRIESRPFLINPVREFGQSCLKDSAKYDRERIPGGEIDLDMEFLEEREDMEFLMWQYIMEAA